MSSLTPKFSNCEDLFAALSQYLDEELTPVDCAVIERHISECAPCVEFVNSLKKTVELCRSPETQPAPPPLSEDLRQRLMEAYRQSMEERSSTAKEK